MINKIIKLLTLVFIFIILTPTFSMATTSPRVEVNGKKISFPDAQPFIDANGRTQVPLRFVSEALGAKLNWNGNTKKVTVVLKSRTLVLTIGKRDYTINNQSYQMDTVALLQESRTFVPIRFVSEALGANVNWNSAKKTVFIKFDPNAPTPPLPPPLVGSVIKYDGISFNNVTDVDEYGRINADKSKEFLMKLANQLSFIKENGKYYIKCDYPKTPKGYSWNLTIKIFYKDGSINEYSTLSKFQEYKIPAEGSFKKETNLFYNTKNIVFYKVTMSINDVKMSNTGLLDVLYTTDERYKRVEFLPENTFLGGFQKYNLNFTKMFQWK